MPKHVRRVTLTRTVTYTTTIDTAGRPEETDANIIIANGGSAGATGVLSIAELLAGSIANNGPNIVRSVWSPTGTSINVEPYIVRPQNTVMTLGQRVASITPQAGNGAAIGKLFVVTAVTSDFKTANSAVEPVWALTDGSTTTDLNVTFRTIPKFYTPTTFVAATVYPVGSILRPSANSQKEFLVTTVTSAASTAPTWSAAAGGYDTIGIASAVPGAGAVICISGCLTFAVLTSYQLGDLVKPSAASAEEYVVTIAGATSTVAMGAAACAVNATVAFGGVTFKRLL